MFEQPMRRASAAVVVLVLLAGACTSEEPAAPAAPSPPPSARTAATPRTGDLAAIRAAGRLRVLVRAGPHDTGLPRRASPLHHEWALAEQLGEYLGVAVDLVPIAQRDGLIPALLAGRGDLIAGNVSVTAARADAVSFTAPLASVREMIVARADDPIAGEAGLAGRTLAVQASAAYWETAQALAARISGLELQRVPESVDNDALVDGVVNGRFDLTMLDDNLLESMLTWRDDVRGAFAVGPVRLIAWAVRPQAEDLRAAVDLFLVRVGLTGAEDSDATADLPGIRKRGNLRVLTRNNAATYYIRRGALRGFEYELTGKLAEELEVRADMVVPPSRAALFDWLRRGRGDLVAANLTASEARAQAEHVVFSEPYFYVTETVVSRAAEPPIGSVEELAGRRVAVRRSSSYWRSLTKLRDEGVALELVPVAETMETEQIIDAVARGEFDLTVADSHIVGIETVWRDDIRGTLELGAPRPLAWAMRPDDTALHEAVNAFIRRHYRGEFYNVVVARYFEDQRAIHARVPTIVQRQGRISPYDELARKYGNRYGFDWRLIVAQMYQESRFDPAARSAAGAKGLMQLLPRTLRQIGLEGRDLSKPEVSVQAGVRYLDWTRDRFDQRVPAGEETWFALAAYNVGQGHVHDARRLARMLDLDPDRWFENVEKAMLMKERRKYYRKTRFGYARGREPVRYVRRIRDRYQAYLQLPLVNAGS